MQKIRYLFGGATGVGAYYLILWILTDKIGVWYVASSIVASFANTIINFLVHKFWTFKDVQTKTVGWQLFQFICLTVIFLFLNSFLLYLLVEGLGLWYITAQMILTVVLTISNFLISRRIFSVQAP